MPTNLKLEITLKPFIRHLCTDLETNYGTIVGGVGIDPGLILSFH